MQNLLLLADPIAHAAFATLVFVWLTKRLRLEAQSLRRISEQLEPVRVTDPRLGRLGCPCGVPCPPIKDREVKSL